MSLEASRSARWAVRPFEIVFGRDVLGAALVRLVVSGVSRLGTGPTAEGAILRVRQVGG